MGAIELTVSDGEETYVISAVHLTAECWEIGPIRFVADGREVPSWSMALHPIASRVYPTPYACLEALFRAVVTELFGVRA